MKECKNIQQRWDDTQMPMCGGAALAWLFCCYVGMTSSLLMLSGFLAVPHQQCGTASAPCCRTKSNSYIIVNHLQSI